MEELSPLEIDTISEVGNISLGASATALSTIINKRVAITTPRLEILTVADVKERFPLPCIVAEVNYITGLQGSNVLLIKEKDARVIASLMMGSPTIETEKPLDEIELSAIQEAMNQMMGLMATSMSEMFHRRIDISPPVVELRNLAVADPALKGLKDQDSVVEVSFKISVEGLIDSTLVQLIPLESARAMAGFLLGEEAGFEQEGEDAFTAASEPLLLEDHYTDEAVSGADVLKEMDEQIFAGTEPVGFGFSDLQELPPTEKNPDDAATMEKLDLVKDLPMDITAILSKTRMPLGKLFDLDKGCIIDLDGNIDEPVELLVNGKLMAYGKVVMVNEQLGVRITKMQLGSTQG